MSDTHTRELQRNAARGDAASEARLLAERVRAGELDPERLRLGAFLGHPAVEELLGSGAPAIPDEADAWTEALEAFGTEVLVRAACSCGWLLLPAWEAFRPQDSMGEAMLRMDCLYLLDPQAREGGRADVDELLEEVGLSPPASEEELQGAQATLRGLALLFEAQGPGVLRSSPFLRLLARLSFASRRNPPRHQILRDVLKIAIETAGLDQVQRWLRRELGPWALGEGDPLGERIRPAPG